MRKRKESAGIRISKRCILGSLSKYGNDNQDLNIVRGAIIEQKTAIFATEGKNQIEKGSKECFDILLKTTLLDEAFVIYSPDKSY